MLKEGLYRLARLATKKTKSIIIIPVGIAYSEVIPKFRGNFAICLGEPLFIDAQLNLPIDEFNETLNKRMLKAEKIALKNIGR